MELIDLNSVKRDKWCILVDKSPVATWFQTPEAYNFFRGLAFVEPFGTAVVDNGELKGLALGWIQKDGSAIKRYLSRRAIVFGGVLLCDDITAEALKALLLKLKNDLSKKAIYLEIRNFNDYSRWRIVFEECGFSYEPHYNVQIDTTSLESVDQKLDRNRKRNIRKAVGQGVVIDTEPSNEDLKRYYAMLTELYRTKVKTPLYPFEFFERLRKVEGSKFFMVKTPTGELTGGLVCVCLEGRAVYVWMACGEDRQFRELSPSVMANYAGIRFAAENGFSRFDFMGAGRPDDGGYGVRDFKLDFGGTLVEHGRFLCVRHPLLFKVGKLGVNLMKRL